jgi:hypothetical protein
VFNTRDSFIRCLKAEVQAAYRLADRVVKLAGAVDTSVMFAAKYHRRWRQIRCVPDATLITQNIGRLAAQCCIAQPLLVRVETQIVAARGIQPFVLAGAHYPCAYTAVIGLAIRVLDSVCRAWAREPRLCLTDCPNPVDAEAWAGVYHQEFRRERLVDGRGKATSTWKAYCQRCFELMPRYDTGMILTALSQEAVQWDKALPPATKLKGPEQGDVLATPGQDPTAYRPAKDFIDGRHPNFTAIEKALKRNLWIKRARPLSKSGKSVPNRLRIHAGDWKEYQSRLAQTSADSLDLPAETVLEAVNEVERRKAQERARKPGG